MIFAGLDLSGYKQKSKTVLSFIEDKDISVYKGLEDDDIIKLISIKKDVILAIDSPLSFPKKNYFRYSDKKLRKFLERKNLSYLKKFILPPFLPGMKILTKRGIKIKNSLKGVKVIETHPTISIFLILYENNLELKDFLKYKRNFQTFKELQRILEKILGYELKFQTPDELDSFICAYISYLFYKKEKIYYLSKAKFPFVIYNPFKL
ncbi:MAG: hypothetical protein ABIM49_00935 [candidate division WOR-3 bacterium]